VGLIPVLEELPQLGAAAVDLVAAEEVEGDPVRQRLGGDVDGQLPLGTELQAGGRPIAANLAGSSTWARGIHCRAPISECPACSRT
jgi:hypothetical protein